MIRTILFIGLSILQTIVGFIHGIFSAIKFCSVKITVLTGTGKAAVRNKRIDLLHDLLQKISITANSSSIDAQKSCCINTTTTSTISPTAKLPTTHHTHFASNEFAIAPGYTDGYAPDTGSDTGSDTSSDTSSALKKEERREPIMYETTQKIMEPTCITDETPI